MNHVTKAACLPLLSLSTKLACLCVNHVTMPPGQDQRRHIVRVAMQGTPVVLPHASAGGGGWPLAVQPLQSRPQMTGAVLLRVLVEHARPGPTRPPFCCGAGSPGQPRSCRTT